MIDANVMNDQLGKEERYKRRDSIEPTGSVQFEMYEDDAETGLEPEREYNNPIHTEEEELLPGLFQSDIDSWKKQVGDVWMADIKGEQFIYRTLQRYEYKEIVAIPNTDPLMREEMICEYCVMYPQGYDFASMANKKAGIPAVLSEVIMEHSGFTRDVKISKL